MKFQITIANIIYNMINYKLQLKLQIVDEAFLLRALNNIFQAIINIFGHDIKERACLRTFFYKLDLRKQEIVKFRHKSKLRNPIKQDLSSDPVPEENQWGWGFGSLQRGKTEGK